MNSLAKAPAFERIGKSLYRKGATIYARIRINGRLTWRSTGTGEAREARKWLKKWKMKRGCSQMALSQRASRSTVSG